MTLEKAGFVRGWMFATKAPQEIVRAMDEVISALNAKYNWPEEVQAIQHLMNDHAGEIADLEHKVKQLKTRGPAERFAEFIREPDPVAEPEEKADDEQPETPPHTGKPRGQYEWTDQNRADLFTLREKGRTWPEIGRHLGRTGAACSSMWHLLKKKQTEQSGPAANGTCLVSVKPDVMEMLKAKKNGGHAGKRDPGGTAQWYPDDWGMISQMLLDGATREEIAADYGVTLSQLDEFISQNTPPDGDDKVSAFIREHGVTKCPPVGNKELVVRGKKAADAEAAARKEARS
jgi:hypothetical protein